MNIITNITREKFISKFDHELPVLESDFCLEITNAPISDNGVFVYGFTMPQLGISFNPDTQNLGYQTPSLGMGSFSISYLRKGFESDLFEVMYKNQFTEGGVLKFVPESSRPCITLYRDSPVLRTTMVRYEYCKFSMPMPSINMSSASVSVFTTIVSFSNYQIL